MLIWKAILEIFILWIIIYHIILFFVEAHTLPVLQGILTLLAAFFLFQKLNLGVLSWMLAKIFGISIIALLVIFHSEIRQGLARLGAGRLFGFSLKEQELDHILIQVNKAIDSLCKDKVGALFAFEKRDVLNSYIHTGVLLDAQVSADLIHNIFTPLSLLHDGGVIIQNGRIMAAGCLFPLTQKQELSRIFGMRHRAALGLSEETDAIVLIVSEERQDVSLAYEGKFYRDLSREELINKIKDLFKK